MLLEGAQQQQYHMYLICLGNQNNLISQTMIVIMKMKVPVSETTLFNADPDIWGWFLVHCFCLYCCRARGHGCCSSWLLHWNASEGSVIIHVFSPFSSLFNKVHLIQCNSVAHWLLQSDQHAWIALISLTCRTAALNRKYLLEVHGLCPFKVQEHLEQFHVFQWT